LAYPDRSEVGVLYGKWRPRGFGEVVGQDHIVTTLRNALATGQVAHAYLFNGPRGTGKTTTARILARAVNCANLVDGEPCNECASCAAILKGAALDLIEMDAASNRGIDDVRELRDRINYAPSDLVKKVYLLDEVHMLTPGAFNALLKTLEEPPPHAIFILATTEFHDVPATIVSRCQRYDFHRMATDAAVSRLRFICEQEGFNVPEQGLVVVANQARGGMRDAITLLEQVIARYGPSPSTDDVLEALGLVHDPRSEQLATAVATGDLAGALETARDAGDSGIDMARFTREVVDILRDVLLQILRGRPDADSPYRAVAEAAAGAKATPAVLANAVQQLAGADFRLDPASAIPLEVACATAILGPAVAVPASPAAAPGPSQAPRPERPPARSAGSNRTQDNAPKTPEERFFSDLYDRSRAVDVRVAAKLNGSCEVVRIDESEIELGVYYQFHLEALEREGREILEQQAAAILGRPVRLKFTLVERKTQGPKASARTGHLAETAKALGAVPVGKDE
jgi:DNA polymerase-3 subunit gamma/tau